VYLIAASCVGEVGIMTQKRVLLRVKRFKQRKNECAVAAASSLANYFNPEVEYEEARKLVSPRIRRNGIHTSQSGLLLNKLGFASVKILTADQSLIDFSWRNLSKTTLIKKLKRKRAYCGRARDRIQKAYVNGMIRWLESEPENELIIDWDFPKYIRRQLDFDRPVGISINWTTMFRYPKAKAKGKSSGRGDISGDVEDHAIVLRGYDSDGVFVVDADDNNSSQGYYKLSWETLLINIPDGDLIWVE